MAFTPPASIEPKKLMEVAGGLVAKGYEFGVRVFPLRKGKDAKRLILDGRGNELSLAEWALFLEDRNCWAACSRLDVDDLILLVYEQVIENASLREMFAFKLALGMQDSKLSIVQPLFENLDLVKDRLSSLDSLRFSWIEYIYYKNYAQVIEYCIGQNQNYQRVMVDLGWAGLTKLDELLFSTLLEAVCAARRSDALLLEYLSTLEIDRCVRFLNCIFTSNMGISDRVKAWVRSNASPVAENAEIWERLDDAVQLVIINKLDLDAFFLINPLMKDLASALEQLQEEEAGREVRRLRSRYNFWTNYTNSIVTAKWLHHPKVLKLMQSEEVEGAQIGLLLSDLSDREDSYSSPFLVLEFSEYLVVDQLLHSFGVVKIFKKNAVLLNKLFHGNLYTSPCHVSLKSLLLEIQLDVHDHMQFWQGSLEKKLREQYKILPDRDISTFRGLPSSIKYHPKYGLPTPSLVETKKRNEQLLQWEAAYFASEKQLGKYSSDEALNELETQIKKPRIGRLLQTKETRVKALTELKVEVENNKYWATKLLGEHLLTTPNLSKKDRMDGEKYLEKTRQWGRVTSVSGRTVQVAKKNRAKRIADETMRAMQYPQK